ncbi:MAG: non-ribosomal peptide synthetase, partial [Chloroflexota bacterium]|nr:non-ribosomal peptide synthetase [Chloroflexota bacterium]
MNLTTVLSRLAENNIKLWAEGEQLRVQAPKGVMTPDLRELIVANKAALLAWLQMGEDEANLALPQIMLQPATRHQPFPLTDIQHAYWIGRSGALALGNVSAHGYMEFDYTHLDLERLTAALNQVIARHEMLRAIALPTGEQQILAVTQPYVIPVLDLRDFSEAAQTEQLAAVREELSHQVLPTDQSPLFDIRVTRLSDSRILLHISIDLLMFDLASLSIIFSEWRAFHENPKVVFAPLELSFRDYVLAEQGLKSTALYAKARDYWLNRIDNLAAAPELPVALTSAATAPQIFRRRLYQLDAATWHALKSKAQQTSITPSVLLLTAFAAVLKNWCKQPHFTLNLTLFNR